MRVYYRVLYCTEPYVRLKPIVRPGAVLLCYKRHLKVLPLPLKGYVKLSRLQTNAAPGATTSLYSSRLRQGYVTLS